jgi:hypothetical protein
MDGLIALETHAHAGGYYKKDIHGYTGPLTNATDAADVLKPEMDVEMLVRSLNSEGYTVALEVLS